MGVPDYVLRVRAHIGHDLLLMPGVCVIVVRPGEHGREVLLVQRADDGEWTPVTGCADPGEDADVTARRECLEETGVDIEVARVTWIETLPVITYANGDRSQYYDVCLLARYVAGEAHVADDESVAVGWFAEDALPPMNERFSRKVAHALSGDTRVLIGAEGR